MTLVNVETGEVVSYADVRRSVDAAKSRLEEAAEQIVWQIEHQAWAVLGYTDWNEMREAEYGGAAFIVPREDRPELMTRMRRSGLTHQQIAHVMEADFGGRATTRMVTERVRDGLAGHFVDYLVGKGLHAEVNSVFRAKSADGLPAYPEANLDGEHVQLSLLSVAECKHVATRYLTASAANYTQAEKIRALCLEVHGITLDLDALAEEAS